MKIVTLFLVSGLLYLSSSCCFADFNFCVTNDTSSVPNKEIIVAFKKHLKNEDRPTIWQRAKIINGCLTDFGAEIWVVKEPNLQSTVAFLRSLTDTIARVEIVQPPLRMKFVGFTQLTNGHPTLQMEDSRRILTAIRDPFLFGGEIMLEVQKRPPLKFRQIQMEILSSGDLAWEGLEAPGPGRLSIVASHTALSLSVETALENIELTCVDHKNSLYQLVITKISDILQMPPVRD